MRFFLTLLLFHVILILQAQVVQPAGKMYVNTAPGGIVNEIFQIEVETTNHYYLNEEWRNGSIFLKSGMALKNVPIRYDFLSGLIELKYNNEVRTMRAQFLDYFEFSDTLLDKRELYIHASKLVPDELGFYKLLHDDVISLVRKDVLDSREPTYVAALDVGDRAVQYFLETSYFMVRNDELFPFEKKKKQRQIIFGSELEVMDDYIKENKLDWNLEEDLIRMVSYLNQLRK